MLYRWLHSHTGLKTDRAAKMVPITLSNFKIPYTDFKASIKESVRLKWQASWNYAVNIILHVIKPSLG
jgi:hypothetical protein